jgi:hypothetical protein
VSNHRTYLVFFRSEVGDAKNLSFRNFEQFTSVCNWVPISLSVFSTHILILETFHPVIWVFVKFNFLRIIWCSHFSTWRMPSSGMLLYVALVRNDVFFRRVYWLLVSTNVVPS